MKAIERRGEGIQTVSPAQPSMHRAGEGEGEGEGSPSAILMLRLIPTDRQGREGQGRAGQSRARRRRAGGCRPYSRIILNSPAANERRGAMYVIQGFRTVIIRTDE